MDNSVLVRSLERLRDLFRNRQRLVGRHGTARDALGQRLALDQLEDQGACLS